jgi:hypothetical protein
MEEIKNANGDLRRLSVGRSFGVAHLTPPPGSTVGLKGKRSNSTRPILLNTTEHSSNQPKKNIAKDRNSNKNTRPS